MPYDSREQANPSHRAQTDRALRGPRAEPQPDKRSRYTLFQADLAGTRRNTERGYMSNPIKTKYRANSLELVGSITLYRRESETIQLQTEKRPNPFHFLDGIFVHQRTDAERACYEQHQFQECRHS